ncbi:LacI family DNA-binding transcriptional regulator [Actinomyces urinae]|uniref:LacI family DNA-binding transcriptional regulator n=1 Tax=Actinomyces urinae TaxID=1689268 RepID=UPI0009303419|nr:LacI family DNA-binding transcriptional regulator [Actinomyces urinae]
MRAGPKRRVTRDEVAARAGVSSAVVSYVVNNGPRPVAESTRLRVLEAIEELGYHPSGTARALRLGARQTCGVVIPNVKHLFNSAVVHRLDQELSRHNLSMLLSNTHDSPETEKLIIREMLSWGVDGLIIMMSTLNDEWHHKKLPVPTILLDRRSGLEHFTTLGPDFAAGGRIATQHLIDHGHEEILAVLGGLFPGDNTRLAGYQRALSDAGLQSLTPITTSWSLEGGYEAGKQFLKLDSRPSAVFCFSDALAIGFQKAITEAGVRVPQDVAIMGFDGTDTVKYVQPRITTVRQPIDEMLTTAVEILVKEPYEPVKEHMIFPVSLAPGESCGCPRIEGID